MVSAAERDGVTVIAVTLNASDDWNDHQKMFDYGFTQYRNTMLCKAGDHCFPLAIVGGIEQSVPLRNTEGLEVILPIDHPPITVTVEMRPFEYAPIRAGEALGAVVYRCDLNGDGTEEVIGTVALNAEYPIECKKQKKTLWQWICSLFGF